jgi:glycine oxidase
MRVVTMSDLYPLPPSRSPHLSPAPVLVLGAGLMGRMLALALAQAGHPVQLVDAGGPDADGAAARVAAAMLAPLAESAVTEPPVVAMGQYALARWPQLLAGLVEPVFFQHNGTLVVWHRQDATEAQRFQRQLQATTQALPHLPKPQSLNRDSLAEREPALQDRFHQGLYLPGEGQLDNRGLLQALLHTLTALGVTMRWHSAWTQADALAHQQRHGGWVLDCRGLGGQPSWSQLRGVRGEVVRLHAPDVTLQRPTRLLHPRYPIYIAPKPGHVFVIGATEIETDDRSPASVRSVLELLSAAYAVHPGFAEARILELSAQCRPTLPDNLPAVQAIGPQALRINGLYRHGFMIAPAVLDAVLEHLWHGNHTLADRLQLHFALDESPACA